MSIKHTIKKTLESLDFYYKIRYSNFFLKLWLKKESFEVLKKEEQYYLKFLSKLKKEEGVVFDIGANEGFIAEFFLKDNLQVIAVEPDERNQKILTARFQNNARFKLIKKGLSEAIGTATIYLHKTNSALNTLNEKWKESIDSKYHHPNFLPEKREIELSTLDQLIKDEGIPSFIKIDVEGHELEVIRGLKNKVPLLSFEANFPEFKKETFLILEMLEKICGESEFNFSKNYQLALPDFVNRKVLENYLEKLEGEECLEIICKMSNYLDFYEG